ncbi:MAG: nucleoside-triphosphatase [Oscillospiraceae bacterium]
MHIFLTGDVQVGKSTVIQKVISGLNLSIGGFRTGFGPNRGQPDRQVYLWDAGGEPVYDEDHVVVRFSNRAPEVLIDRFNTLGVDILRQARQRQAGLILMDECGRFEGKAAAFQAEIFAALEGTTPVLGVVRQGFHGWLDDLRSHPRVTLLPVTADNRDVLPDQIAALLRANK